MRFVDTNVLLYAASKNSSEQWKAQIAQRLLDQTDLATSVQALQEFYTQATRPSRRDPLTHAQAAGLVESWMRFPVQEITVPVFWAAIATKIRFQISYWDAAIVESARALGCSVILSEDLADGQDYAGVRVENPFR